ncbi:MAG TPA: hypothetical protein VJ947_04260, partial [Pseudohaliea sp.]|nr:hypothetical protein [Pseudohaliea sp.]
ADRPDLRAAMAAAAGPAVAPHRLEHAAATFLALAERLAPVPGLGPAADATAGRPRLPLPQGAGRG